MVVYSRFIFYDFASPDRQPTNLARGMRMLREFRLWRDSVRAKMSTPFPPSNIRVTVCLEKRRNFGHGVNPCRHAARPICAVLMRFLDAGGFGQSSAQDG
jgi:hypothetical protein